MIRFNSDYLEGAHPRVMARLMETNMDQTPGYGEDACCDAARAVIRERRRHAQHRQYQEEAEYPFHEICSFHALVCHPAGRLSPPDSSHDTHESKTNLNHSSR